MFGKMRLFLEYTYIFLGLKQTLIVATQRCTIDYRPKQIRDMQLIFALIPPAAVEDVVLLPVETKRSLLNSGSEFVRKKNIHVVGQVARREQAINVIVVASTR